MTPPPAKKRPRKSVVQRVRRWLYLAAAVCLAWWAVLYFFQDHLLFASSYAPAPAPAPMIPTTEIWTLPIEDDDRVEAWFIPALHGNTTSTSSGATSPQQDTPQRRPAVVFFHGNAELVDHQHAVVSRYRDLGCHVLLVEYRGYGRSTGQPSQESIRSDAMGFMDRLLQRPDVDPAAIIYHGRSIGGGVAADLASVRPPRVLVLESTFRSVEAMASRLWAPPLLVKNPYRTEEVLAHADFPTLIFHGSVDRVIPVEHGRALRDAAKHGQYFELPTDHNTLIGSKHESEFWKRVRAFLVEQGVLDSA